MKNLILILSLLILINIIIIFVTKGKRVYNQFLAYNFFKQIKEKKFKKAFIITKLIFEKKIKIYLIVELVKTLLLKNRVEQAYYIYLKSENIMLKMAILELIILNCIKNENDKKIDKFLSLTNSYDIKRYFELYKQLIIYYENKRYIDKIRNLEYLSINNLDFYIALSYIRLESLEDTKTILKKINNSKQIGLLIYESFRYYRDSNRLDEFEKFYYNIDLSEEIKKNIVEFLIKINIENKNYNKVEELMENLSYRKKFDYYIIISKNLVGTVEFKIYLDKAYDLIRYFIFESEKIMALIRLAYLTIKINEYSDNNKFLDESYELYLTVKNESIDMTKEFIPLFREYKKYDIFTNLLEKKAKIYKEVIKLEEMNEIKSEFIKSINMFLWGDVFDIYQGFMKSYNLVQLKNCELEYEEFYELLHQIKRYVNEETYKNIDNISLNLINKPNTLFFINQYLKLLKN